MKRLGLGLAGALLLVALPFTLSSCDVACGCATAPDPNWTPPPVTAQEAATYAAKVAGVPEMTAELSTGLNGRPFYEAKAANIIGFVDAVSGIVLEVVLVDRMPIDSTVSASLADARAAGEAFMRRIGQDTAGLVESVALTQLAGVAAYSVTWNDTTSATAPKFEIAVNASSGVAFVFLDLRMQLSLALPIVGRDRASELAIAAFGVPGETVTSADLTIDFYTGSQRSVWAVGLGVPTPTQADVFEHGALVSVDAVTGLATVVKS